MYKKIQKNLGSNTKAVTNLVSHNKNSGEHSFSFVDNRSDNLLQRRLNPDFLSTPKIKGTIQRVLRVNWPDSVTIDGKPYAGKDGGDSGIYYELPVDSRAKDRHISIHKAGENMMDWFRGPGFSVKVHQTRNKYVIAHFFGGSFLAFDYGSAQEQGQKEASQEAVEIGVGFYSAISGSTKETF